MSLIYMAEVTRQIIAQVNQPKLLKVNREGQFWVLGNVISVYNYIYLLD